MDNSVAFGPASLEMGAMLPADGRDVIIRSAGLPPGIMETTADGWLAPGIPILVRGAAKIIPLAWHGAPGSGYNPYAEPQQIAKFASHVQGACLHRAGPWSLLDLAAQRGDSIGSYIDALNATAATRAICWVYTDADPVGVALVWAGDENAGTMSLALHIVPSSWVFERGSAGAVRGIDVRWSWSEVIDLYAAPIEAEQSGAADNLTEADQEGQDS